MAVKKKKRRIFAVIVAAGSSTRMRGRKGSANKVFMDLGGRPVLYHSIKKFLAVKPRVDEIIVVSAPGEEIRCLDVFNSVVFEKNRAAGGAVSGDIVTGGDRRGDSVLNGLLAAAEDLTAEEASEAIVFVHDAARPNFDPKAASSALSALIGESESAGGRCGLAFATASHDTLCTIDGAGNISGYADRAVTFRLQTPQLFFLGGLIGCFLKAEKKGLEFTDETSLARHFGGKVGIVEGSPENFKITTQNDYSLMNLLFTGPRK